jgi:hypothetical protein
MVILCGGKGALGTQKRSKDQCEPLDCDVRRIVGRAIGSEGIITVKSENPSLRLNPWKARGAKVIANTKPARDNSKPRLRNPSSVARRLPGRIAKRHHAPAASTLCSLPQPMGAGSSRPLSPPRWASCHTEERCSGCKGKKTLASQLGSRPRERPYREEKPTANDDAIGR